MESANNWILYDVKRTDNEGSFYFYIYGIMHFPWNLWPLGSLRSFDALKFFHSLRQFDSISLSVFVAKNVAA